MDAARRSPQSPAPARDSVHDGRVDADRPTTPSLQELADEVEARLSTPGTPSELLVDQVGARAPELKYPLKRALADLASAPSDVRQAATYVVRGVASGLRFMAISTPADRSSLMQKARPQTGSGPGRKPPGR